MYRLIIAAAFFSATAYASPITYNYTGNEFTHYVGGWEIYFPGGHVTASVTTDNGLVTAWGLYGSRGMGFTSYIPPGCPPYAPACYPQGSASITVDADGNVTDWYVNGFNSQYGYFGGGAGTSPRGDSAYINNLVAEAAFSDVPGVWTVQGAQVTVPNPEPRTAFLMLIAIVLAAGFGRGGSPLSRCPGTQPDRTRTPAAR